MIDENPFIEIRRLRIFFAEGASSKGTPPKTNMSPKKDKKNVSSIQKEIHLPTIDFQGTC